MTTLRQVRNLFNKDTELRKGNKSSNEPIIKLINLVNNDNAIIDCEPNNSGTALNRGSVVECLIKMLAYKTNKVSKAYNETQADLIVNGVRYEIKYSSSKGYAHYNPNQDLSNLIFVDASGIYLTNGNEIVLDKCGKHIKTINKVNAKVLVRF